VALSRRSPSNETELNHHSGASLTTGSSNIDIQASGVASESNTTRIGPAKQTEHSGFAKGSALRTLHRLGRYPSLLHPDFSEKE
jgi:hypothetical protein